MRGDAVHDTNLAEPYLSLRSQPLRPTTSILSSSAALRLAPLSAGSLWQGLNRPAHTRLHWRRHFSACSTLRFCHPSLQGDIRLVEGCQVIVLEDRLLAPHRVPRLEPARRGLIFHDIKWTRLGLLRHRHVHSSKARACSSKVWCDVARAFDEAGETAR